MRHFASTCLCSLIVLVSAGLAGGDTFPPLATVDLCGPGTTWMSLPTHSDMMTAEEICLAAGSAAVSVAQRFPDTAGTYIYECGTGMCCGTTGPCTAPVGPVPEPGCSTSTCFCVDSGEGFEITTSAPVPGLPINGCDEMVSLSVPFLAGPGTAGTLVSVPYDTFLTSWNDLGIYFGLASTGLPRGSVTGRNCATGSLHRCDVGTVNCATLSLVPGQAYALRATVSGATAMLNPATCTPPGPLAADCPIDTLSLSSSGGTNTLSWSDPPGCPLPLTYEVARGDLDCLAHHCSICPSCTILGTTLLTTLVDPAPPSTPIWYLVRVVDGTWNSTASTQCKDRDIMFSLGCP